MAQKAKIRWAIEGDENTKYFHGIINKKRSQLAIRGVLVNGDWIEEPSKVKDEFLNHFANRFSKPGGPCMTPDASLFKQISFDQNVDLESDVNYEEIKRAVWDCGTNKSPGPDGFTFEFFRRYWNIINQDVVNAVQEFFASGTFPSGCNSSFITLIPKKNDAKLVKDFRPISLIGSFYKIIAKILANRLSLVMSDLISDVQSAFVPNRQILDGPFILSELIQWCKYHKSKAMIFKADFEKAFDSVRWDYLDGILSNFGFGAKWRGWIQGCLNSAKGSILVNGSPSSEFSFHKGLKQGDPLSLFLFILVMETLHISFNNILNARFFKGIRINESLTLSHLFYADDAIFIGTWDKANVISMVHMLNYFYMASGLKINIIKSSIMGIGTTEEEVNSAAKIIGCSTFSSPFKYLGVKVGSSISETVSGMRKFFNGVDNNERKINMIGWKKILAVKRKGGLGVSSFFAYNRALLFKWVWRLRSDQISLWSRLIKAIHGDDIINRVRSLYLKGINLLAHVKKKVGNGSTTLFWKDPWFTESPLIKAFPRLFALESNKNATVAEKFHDISLLHSLRRRPRGGSPTRWVKTVSIKINIFAWKVCLDRLPTRLNLSLRGIDIPSISCPICSSAGESCAHLLFSCSMAKALYSKVARWCEMEIPVFDSYKYWLNWFISLRFSKAFKDMLEGIFFVMWWEIWKFRNQILFGTFQPRMACIFDDIVCVSFLWVSNRCKNKIDWISWLKCPSSLTL
ncbi:RNA-directed DNA polymerase, eukaryota [Tanacetum coccineum]